MLFIVMSVREIATVVRREVVRLGRGMIIKLRHAPLSIVRVVIFLPVIGVVRRRKAFVIMDRYARGRAQAKLNLQHIIVLELVVRRHATQILLLDVQLAVWDRSPLLIQQAALIRHLPV